MVKLPNYSFKMNKSIKTKNIFQDLQETHRHSIHRTRQKPKSWRRVSGVLGESDRVPGRVNHLVPVYEKRQK